MFGWRADGRSLTHVNPIMGQQHLDAVMSYRQQLTGGAGARQSAAAAAAADAAAVASLSSLSDNLVSSFSVVPPRLPQLDVIRHQQVWRPLARPPPPSPRLPYPTLDAVQSAVRCQPAPTTTATSTCFPPPYLNLRLDVVASEFSGVPRALANVPLRSPPARGVSFQASLPMQLSVPPARRELAQSNYQRQQYAYQHQQQHQQQPVPRYSQNQLMQLLTRHCRLTEHVFCQTETSLNAVVNELWQATTLQTYVPSAFLCELQQLVSREEGGVWRQHRDFYRTAYNALVADPGVLTHRVDADFVMDSMRTVSMCSADVDAATRELRAGMPSLTRCASTHETETTYAALLLHVALLRFYLNLFRETLTAYETHVFRRPPGSGHATLCSDSQSMADTKTGEASSLSTSPAGGQRQQQLDAGEKTAASDDELQRALSDDVDQLLLDQQLQQQHSVTCRDSSTCQPVSSSMSTVVDELSNFTRPLIAGVSHSSSWMSDSNTTSTVNQTQPLQATSTSGANVAKAPEVLQFRQADFGCVTGDHDEDRGAALQPFSDDDRKPAATAHLTDPGQIVEIVSAVDLMPLGGFSLFVPFQLPADRQPEDSAPAAVSSDVSGSRVVVKQEQPDVIASLLLPTDDVTSEQETQDAAAGGESRPAVTAAADVDAAHTNSDLICSSIATVPLDGVETIETSSSSSSASAELPECAVRKNQTMEHVTAAVQSATSERHEYSVPASVASTTTSSSTNVSTELRQKSLKLTMTAINGEIICKRKTSDHTDDVRQQKARKVDYGKSTSAKLSVAPANYLSTWVCQKKLIIAPPPAPPAVKRLRGHGMSAPVMKSPVKLRPRPAACKTIPAPYRSAQFSPLDGIKRKRHLQPKPKKHPAGGQRRRHCEQKSSVSGARAESLKTTVKCNKSAWPSTSSAADEANASIKNKLNNKNLNAGKRSLRLRNDAQLDRCMQDSGVKSSDVSESSATTESDAHCSTTVQSQTVDLSAMEAFSVNSNVPSQKDFCATLRLQHVDKNSSTLSFVDVHSHSDETATAAAVLRRTFYPIDKSGPPEPACCMESTAGDHVTLSTSSRPSPLCAWTSSKLVSGSMFAREDENNSNYDYFASSAGAPMFSRDIQAITATANIIICKSV